MTTLSHPVDAGCRRIERAAPRQARNGRLPYRGGVPPIIRPARLPDVQAIAAAYGHAVRTSVATFDTDDPPASYWAEKVSSEQPGDHAIVLELDGAVAGFAYSTAFRPRPAYAYTRETSIYFGPEAVGHGWGRTTYTRLLDLVRGDGMHCAVAVVAQPNPASTALHEALGFELVGTLREVGRKFDRWVDTRWYQLMFER
jgi:phosphinothricin acetyltransferase